MRIMMGGKTSPGLLYIGSVFGGAGHVVDQAGDCTAALEAARTAGVDAVVLYPETIDQPLLRAAASLRNHSPQVAILVFATAAAKQDVCALLESGADDVVCTPSGKTLMLARLMAVIRRAKGHAVPVITIGSLSLCLGRRECEVNGKVIPLTKMEYRLVEALALRRGQPVPRSLLLELLYPAGTEPFPKSIDLFVHNVRRKLAPQGLAGCLESFGRGFVLKGMPAASAT